MEEYYCTKCGAALDDQPGFDPSQGYWTCTECGQLLVDGSLGGDDLYPDVAWYCDGCGAFLNKQSGFTDLLSTWVCTECGYINSIGPDDIYESELDRQLHKAEEERQQSDTSDVDDAADPDENDGDDEDTSGDPDDDLFSALASTIVTAAAVSTRKTDKELRGKRIKAFLFKGRKVPVGYSSSELVGQDVFDVEEKLHNQAFKHITLTPIKDVYTDSEFRPNEVALVSIGGTSTFGRGDLMPYDAQVTITYHAKREIAVPFSPRALKRQDHTDVAEIFKGLGFTGSIECTIPDLTTGWIKKVGSVESVSIQGDPHFKKGSIYPYDAEIMIAYHTKRH